VNVQSQKRPALMVDPVDTGREGNYRSSLTGEVLPTDCSSFPEITEKNFGHGMLTRLLARSV